MGYYGCSIQQKVDLEYGKVENRYYIKIGPENGLSSHYSTNYNAPCAFYIKKIYAVIIDSIPSAGSENGDPRVVLYKGINELTPKQYIDRVSAEIKQLVPEYACFPDLYEEEYIASEYSIEDTTPVFQKNDSHIAYYFYDRICAYCALGKSASILDQNVNINGTPYNVRKYSANDTTIYYKLL